MKNLFYLSIGAFVYGTIVTLWALAESYLTEGYGLHPVIVGWLSAALLFGAICVAIGDRK